MRTKLTVLLVGSACLLGVGTAGAKAAEAVFVGDIGSVDRAVLEAAELSMPSLDARPTQRRAPSQQPVKPAAYTASRGPAANASSTQVSESAKRGGLFDRMKTSWPFSKQKQEPAADPFAQAQQQSRQRLMNPQGVQRDAAVQPIAAFAQPTENPISTAGFERRGGPKRVQPKRTPSMTPIAKQSKPVASQRVTGTPSMASGRSQGIALRRQSGPRQGLLSGLWSDSQKTTPSHQSQATRPTQRQQAFASSGSPTRQARTYGQLNPKPSLGAAPRPKQIASRSTGPQALITSPAKASRSTTGDIVMVSDSDGPAAGKAPTKRKAVKIALSEPTATRTPSKPVAMPKRLAAKQPQTKAITLPPEPKALAQVGPIVHPVASQPKTLVNLPVEDAEPSERSRALLAEAHDLAATAANYEEFSAVVQRCRYVLAIDKSSEAKAYANQLAGWALTKRGDTLDSDGRFDEARIDYQEALRADSECWRAEHALGVLAARGGDADTALACFNRTIELNPEHAKAYSNRAALSVQAGRYEEALTDYAEAIAVDPDLSVAHTGRGRVCHMLGQMDEGLQHLDAAQVLDPQDAMIATGRGDLLTDLGHYGQAISAYQRAIVLEPQSAPAYRNLAWLQATCPVESFRDGEAALRNVERAAELSSEVDDLTFDTKAAALATLGRFDEAKELQQRAIELAPESDGGVYRERLAMYELGEAFTSQPVGVQQATYTK